MNRSQELLVNIWSVDVLTFVPVLPLPPPPPLPTCVAVGVAKCRSQTQTSHAKSLHVYLDSSPQNVLLGDSAG